MDEELHRLARTLGDKLAAAGWRLVTAESCTGGWIAKTITDIPGSSRWLEGGFVTYSNQAKQDLLAVRSDTLATHGAVSDAVVREMASGALSRSRVQVAVAVSGIAGPGGGSSDKPVGTVWLAWAIAGQAQISACRLFHGDREAVRRQAVAEALKGLIDLVPGDG
jgi:nicotinamide-nucleotide amidase